MLLRQIQHFQTVVQANSFTEAAELCHISQSGISHLQGMEYKSKKLLRILEERQFRLLCGGFCGDSERYVLISH